MSSGRCRTIHLAIGFLVVIALHGHALAQNSVSGSAYGVFADVANVAELEADPSVLLPDDGGSTQAHLASITVPGLASTGTLDAVSSGTIGVASATATSTSTIEDLDLLAGLVTADLLVSKTSCAGDGVTASCNAAGTTFLNLVVAGVPVVGQPPPNTVIVVPGVATITLNEQIFGGNGTSTASLTVSAVHVVLLGGLGEAVVSHAHSDVDFRSLANACLCPQPDDALSGEAYGTLVDVLMATTGKNPLAVLSSEGGNAQAQAQTTHVATVLDTGTVTATTSGVLLPGNGSATSSAVVQSADLLGGVIHADVVQAKASCTGNGSVASCTAAGTTVVSLSILGGLPVNVLAPPNTAVPLLGIGTLFLNEQIAGGNGTTTASLTVNVIHLHVANLLLGTGDIVVASAHAGVDVSPANVCPNPCDDGNPCNGVEVCDPFGGCGPGAPLACDDHDACNGVETCSSASGCMLGVPLHCDDANVCNGVETCNPQAGCVPGTPLACDDGDPCTGQETCNPTTGCQPGIPQCPGPGCLVERSARIKDGSLVTGNFGVNSPTGQVNLGQEVFMPDGTTLFANLVKLRNGVSVFNVLANSLLVGKDVSIRGTTGAPVLPAEDPFCPIPDVPCGTQDVLVAKNVSAPALVPGSYRSLMVMNGASVSLSPGAYQFCQVMIGRGASIEILGPQATTIDVDGSFKLGNGSTFVPSANAPTPTLDVGGSRLKVGAQSVLEARVSAPNARMSLGRSSRIAGTFCALKLNTDANAVVECVP
jgi:hypothetical protein